MAEKQRAQIGLWYKDITSLSPYVFDRNLSVSKIDRKRQCEKNTSMSSAVCEHGTQADRQANRRAAIRKA